MQKKLWIIWSAFIYAVLIYAGISYFLLQPTISNTEMVPFFAGVTVLMSVISAVMSIVIRVKLLSGPIQDGRLLLDTEAGFQKYQTISIITWALSESIAVFGLILVVISGIFFYVIPYCVVSLGLLLLQMPTLKSIR